MRSVLVAVLFGVTLLPAWANAKEAQPMEDPAIESRFKALTLELRCLKCQNQTIFDSKAGLADDLRKQIRDQMHEGKTDEQIVDYLVARYGDFVRYRPAFEGKTLVLWVGPFLLFFVGITALVIQLRKRRRLVTDAPLSDDERKRAQMLLEQHIGEKG